jgi:hypothetical protein
MSLIIVLFASMLQTTSEAPAVQAEQPEVIFLGEGGTPPRVSTFSETGTLSGRVAYTIRFTDAGPKYRFVVSVDGLGYTFEIPKALAPLLDVSQKSVTLNSPRGHEVTIIMDYGVPLTGCPVAMRPMNRLGLSTGPRPRVARGFYKDFMYDVANISSAAGVTMRRSRPSR